jgi:hypothetical protein
VLDEVEGTVVRQTPLKLANYYGRVILTEMLVLNTSSKYYLELDDHSSTNYVEISGLTYHAILKDKNCHDA